MSNTRRAFQQSLIVDRVVSRVLVAAGIQLPQTVSPPFSGNYRDQGRATKVFQSYVGESTGAAMEAAMKKLGAALSKAMPDFTCSATKPNLQVLPNSFGNIKVELLVQSPVRVASLLRLVLDSKVSVYPPEKYFLSPNVVFNPPSLSLQFFDPAHPSVYAAMSRPLKGLPTLRDAKALIDQYGIEKLVKALGGPFVGKQKEKPTLKQVKEFIARQRSWLYLDDDTPTMLHYSTREHGNWGDDTPGEADISEAERLVEVLREEYGALVEAFVDTSAEWTSLRVRLR